MTMQGNTLKRPRWLESQPMRNELKKMSSVVMVQGDRLAQACQQYELEDFLVGFMAGFSYFVSFRFPFSEEKKFLQSSLWPLKFWGVRPIAKQETGLPRDTERSNQVWGRIPERDGCVRFQDGERRCVQNAGCGRASVQLLVCAVQRSQEVQDELGCLPGSLHHH